MPGTLLNFLWYHGVASPFIGSTNFLRNQWTGPATNVSTALQYHTAQSYTDMIMMASLL